MRLSSIFQIWWDFLPMLPPLFFAEFWWVFSPFSSPLVGVRRVVLLPEISYFRWLPYPCNFVSSESPSKSRIHRICFWTWCITIVLSYYFLSDHALIASYCRKGDMRNHEVHLFSEWPSGNPSPLLPKNDRNNYSWFCAAGFHLAVSGSKSFSKPWGWHESCFPRFHTFSLPCSISFMLWIKYNDRDDKEIFWVSRCSWKPFPCNQFFLSKRRKGDFAHPYFQVFLKIAIWQPRSIIIEPRRKG